MATKMEVLYKIVAVGFLLAAVVLTVEVGGAENCRNEVEVYVVNETVLEPCNCDNWFFSCPLCNNTRPVEKEIVTRVCEELTLVEKPKHAIDSLEDDDKLSDPEIAALAVVGSLVFSMSLSVMAFFIQRKRRARARKERERMNSGTAAGDGGETTGTEKAVGEAEAFLDDRHIHVKPANRVDTVDDVEDGIPLNNVKAAAGDDSSYQTPRTHDSTSSSQIYASPRGPPDYTAATTEGDGASDGSGERLYENSCVKPTNDSSYDVPKSMKPQSGSDKQEQMNGYDEPKHQNHYHKPRKPNQYDTPTSNQPIYDSPGETAKPKKTNLPQSEYKDMSKGRLNSNESASPEYENTSAPGLYTTMQSNQPLPVDEEHLVGSTQSVEDLRLCIRDSLESEEDHYEAVEQRTSVL